MANPTTTTPANVERIRRDLFSNLNDVTIYLNEPGCVLSWRYGYFDFVLDERNEVLHTTRNEIPIPTEETPS